MTDDLPAGLIPERLAKLIFATAIRDDRASELMTAFINGGTATVDMHTGELVIISQEQLDGIPVQ